MSARIRTAYCYALVALLAAVPAAAQTAPSLPWSAAQTPPPGWHAEKLADALDYAGAQQSSGVLIVADGHLVAERYWPPTGGAIYRQMLGPTLPDGRVREDVASLQKSIVAVLAMIAREQGRLDFDAPASRYLGAGWSRALPAQEGIITVRHIMSMTSGLAHDFTYQGPAGSIWLYNTAVYSRMIGILERAAGARIAALTQRWLTDPLGMTESSWEPRPWAGADANSIGFVTSARDLARLGSMLLAESAREGGTVLSRAEDFAELTAASQPLNPAYGLLWWANRPTTLTAAGARALGPLYPHAPANAWFGLGALQRVLCIVPEQRLVIVRLGAEPEARFVDRLWELLAAAAPTPGSQPHGKMP